MKKKIIIIGKKGFIGSNLVNYFLNKKYKVINIDKLNYSSTPDRFKYFTNNIKYKFNRIVLFNGGRWHSNMGGFGTNINDARMYITFFFA